MTVKACPPYMPRSGASPLRASRLLRGAVTKLQFAPESRWEECAALSRGEDGCAFEEWFGAFGGENIGVEAFFTVRRGLREIPAFIGFRCAFAGRRAFVAEAARLFAGGGLSGAGDFAAFAEAGFGAPFFSGSPDFMELGLVNMWNSFGALTFRPMPDEPFAALASALAVSERWNGLLPAPPALELAYSSPVPHWLGLGLSSEVQGGFALDMKTAEALLMELRPERQ